MSQVRPFARRSYAGFTLLELLVAITVLAMVSTIAWRGLDSLVSTRERLGPESEDIRATLVTLGQFERDLASIPNAKLFALRTSPLKVRLIESGQFVEMLRISPLTATGSSTLQRVIWRVQDGQMIRASSPELRQLREVTAEEMTNTPLLTGVKAMRVRVWRGTEWLTPLPAEADAPLVSGAPVTAGVELEIERTDGRRYRRVMLVG